MMGATGVLLRAYRRSDSESLWELDQECFPPGIAYSRAELRAFLSRKTAQSIVVERDGQVVAFVLGWRRRRTEGHVITLDVRASARRLGLGRRLMLALERRFRAAGVRRAVLETAATNAIAIGLYERLGYRKVARLPGYYGPGLHAWRMEKALERADPGDARGSSLGSEVIGRAAPVPVRRRERGRSPRSPRRRRAG
jgi:ribosomal-protein-alanine N-acetyltransferase